MVKQILRLEGAVFFLAALFFYQQLEGNWLIFGVTLFTLDIFMLGYFKSDRWGARIYNLGHNYLFPAILISYGFLSDTIWMMQAGMIVVAHVALDRFFGFGLKYPDHFKHTHLQEV